MDIHTIEELINELLAEPTQQLGEEQRQFACDYAAGLFAGRLDDLEVETDVDLQQLQGMHVLSHKQTFFIEYFWDEAGQDDARKLGIAGMGYDGVCRSLTDIEGMVRSVDGDERKAIAECSGDWARAKLVAQLARPAETDANFQLPERLTINYDPDKLLTKAAAVRAYRRFYAEALRHIGSESDQRLAEAKRALIRVHVGRLNALAATDVLPGLLSLEEQLARSASHRRVGEWVTRLREVAPVLGDIHDLDDEQRRQMREVYARHLDAIRQGVPLSWTRFVAMRRRSLRFARCMISWRLCHHYQRSRNRSGRLD